VPRKTKTRFARLGGIAGTQRYRKPVEEHFVAPVKDEQNCSRIIKLAKDPASVSRQLLKSSGSSISFVTNRLSTLKGTIYYGCFHSSRSETGGARAARG
jgi:hypothetical protein